ncbi:hypothetical protein CCHL11_03072, partial [Colletotrichum chlorophyti]
MSILLILFLLTALVVAQANHVIHGFEYVGCVNITSDKFNAFVDFGPAYTPEQCQSACAGRNYAAAFSDGCRCGSSLEGFAKVDDALCSNACNGDAKFGFCGYSNDQGCSYANLYEVCDEFPSASASSTIDLAHEITFSTIRLPTITRTIKLATKSTVVVHTIIPPAATTSCPSNDVSTSTPSDPILSTEPTVVVQTVVVHVPPQSSTGLQHYGSLESDPPVATAPSAVTLTFPPQSGPTSLSLTSLIPYEDPPVPVASVPLSSVPGNATIPVTTVSPEGPLFRTRLVDDPPASTTAW